MEKPFCPDAAGHPTLDPTCRLIETFRYVPGQGMHDLSRHLRRLERSARALGFVVDRKGIERQLLSYAAEETMRCRLTVGMVGDIEFEAQRLVPLRRPWRVAIADQRVRSDDWRQQHKTTQRELYDQVRSNLPEGVDELLFLSMNAMRSAKVRSLMFSLYGCIVVGKLPHHSAQAACRGFDGKDCWIKDASKNTLSPSEICGMRNLSRLETL